MAKELSENEFLILQFLGREGSGTAFDVAPSANLTPNTARKILQRLSGRGWVTQTNDRTSQRKPYVLTDSGKSVLYQSAEARRRQKWLTPEPERLEQDAGMAILQRLGKRQVMVKTLTEAVALDPKTVRAVLHQLHRAGFVMLSSQELTPRTLVSATDDGKLYHALYKRHRAVLGR